MYEIKIINKVTENGVTSNVEELVHSSDQDSYRRVASCTYSDGINYIQEAQFVLLSTNPAYNNLHELTTLVQIINTRNNKIVFDGRVEKIYNNGMDSNGIISKTVNCEGSMAYLCDTIQMYSKIPDSAQSSSLTPTLALSALITRHNNVVGSDKQFTVEGNMLTPMLSFETDYRSTLETIKKYILEPAGGELYMSHVRNSNDQLVLKYYSTYNNTLKDTVIQLAHNMVSFSQETDVSNVVTRLIPLAGYRNTTETDAHGRTRTKKSKSRYDIYHASVVTPTSSDPVRHDANSFYIDDTNAIAQYGVIVGTVVFDDFQFDDSSQQAREDSANALMALGKQYLLNNNRIKKSYKAEILDLSLIGLEPDDLEIGASYRFKNSLIPIDEDLRLNKITVDIFNAHRPKVEIGEKTEKITNVAARQAQLIEYDMPAQEFDLLNATLDNSTELIRNATNGKIWIDETTGKMYIADNSDLYSANEIWEYSLGGIGYTPNGINSNFTTAITRDNSVATEFLMANSVTAQNLYITGGTINIETSDNESDLIHLKANVAQYRYGLMITPGFIKAYEDSVDNNSITISDAFISGKFGSGSSDISFTISSETGDFHTDGTVSCGGNIYTSSSISANGDVSGNDVIGANTSLGALKSRVEALEAVVFPT